MGVIGFSRVAVVGVAFCAPVILGSSAGLAGGPYPTMRVCDPSYYTTLTEKAATEVLRELQVNNTVITKPASVLALSCFDNAMTQAAEGGDTFSDTDEDPDALKDAINGAVGGSLTSYYIDNFMEPLDFASMDFTSGTTSDCNRLQSMWDKIKYGLDQPGLMSTLDDYRKEAEAGKDIRGEESPDVATMATTYDTGLHSSTDLTYGINKYGKDYFDAARPNFCAYDPKSGKDAFADSTICKVENAPDLVCSKMSAVPTGVAITYSTRVESTNTQTSPVWSYTCLNPGCYFDIAANYNSVRVDGNATPPSGMKCSPKPAGQVR